MRFNIITFLLLPLVFLFFVELVVDVGSKKGTQHLSYSELYSALSTGGEEANRIETMIAETIVSKRTVFLRLLAFSATDQLYDKFILVSKVYELLYLSATSDQHANSQSR